MAGLVESKKPGTHEVIRAGGFLNIDRSPRSTIVEKEAECDFEGSLAQIQCILSHAFGDDDTFVEVPLLGVTGKGDQGVGIVSHLREPFTTADQGPEVIGLEAELSFCGVEVLQRNGSDTVRWNGTDLSKQVVPIQGREAPLLEVGVQQGTRQDGESDDKNRNAHKGRLMSLCVVEIVLHSAVKRKQIGFHCRRKWSTFSLW